MLVLLLSVGSARAQQTAAPTGPGYLGVQMENLTREDADKLGWDEPRVVRVTGTIADSPAARAGLEKGDIILLLDGQEVENADRFRDRVGGRGAGAENRQRIWRGDKEVTLRARLAERPAEPLQAKAPDTSQSLVLMPDTGGHTGLIRSLAFTKDGRQIVSAGDDKVIRVWDASTGETTRRIRGAGGSPRQYR